MIDERTIEERVESEHKRLEALLDISKVPKQQRSALEAVIDNMAWQRVKLDDTRDEIKAASVVCEYNNGGGQSGMHENPIFKAYINLWRAYMVGLEKFTSYLPKELQEETTSDVVNVLEQVKQMKKGLNSI